MYIIPHKFTYYNSRLFFDSKLIRVIWQYENYGIPNSKFPYSMNFYIRQEMVTVEVH